jgi:DNA-binding transcriptional MerR regulator
MEKKYLLGGEFGGAARLSPKALRLCAEQGLLVPASVDPATGYRYYAPDQLPRARLIARLRQLGLPLARIGFLTDLTRRLGLWSCAGGCAPSATCSTTARR